MLLCGFGAPAFGADDCLTEVLHKKTTVYAQSDDVMITLELQKEKDSIAIPDPQNVFDDKNALKEKFLYKLSFEEYKERLRYTLKNALEVEAKNGRRYRLSPDTGFELVPPSSAIDYTAVIPAGTKFVAKNDGASDRYELPENLTVHVTPPGNIRMTLQLYPETLVERIHDPRTSSVGATLAVEPKKAPLGGYVKLTVKKRDFDFVKARFKVCLRLRGEKEFFKSDNVELLAVKRDEAVLQARIPEKMGNLVGIYFAKPVDLLVVASIPGNEVKRAEVMTQELSVSSRLLAGLIGIFAFIIPWMIAGFVANQTKKNTQKNLEKTKQELSDAEQAKDRQKIGKLKKRVKEQETAVSVAKARPTYNPIWIVSGKAGNASLSLAQILLWSMIVFSASFYILVVSGKLLDLTNDVLVLLGFAGSASVIAKITAAVKDVKGQAIAGVGEKQPRWLDLITSDGRPDLYKFQMALFTTLAAVFVAREIYSALEFPILPSGLLTLIGISNGVYLTAKASSKTAFEELAEIDRERQKAQENFEKLRNEASESAKSLNKAKGVKENAQKILAETKQKLVEAEKAKDTGKIAELKDKVKDQEAALAEATADFKKASKEKTEADTSVKEAQENLKKLQSNFESKKKQALGQG